MKFLENILVTVDFSDSTDFVIENSIQLADKFNSHITLMHVIANDHLNDKLDHFIEESVQTKLSKIASEISAKGIQLKDHIVVHGVPFEKIIDEVETHDYNVIIAGKSSKTESAVYGPGTTVDKLIRKNEVPVWVVKSEPAKPIKKIVCPVDFSPSSQRALDNAITLSRRFKAELSILHIYTPVNYSSIWYEIDSIHENEKLKLQREQEFNDFLKDYDLTDVTYQTVTLEGEVHTKVINYIEQNDIDLLLMGATGRTGLSRLLLGSTAVKVTRVAPCNFVTTKTRDITDDFFKSSLKSMEALMISARESFEEKDYNKAIEKYNIALKHHPYNIPTLLGLIEASEALGDQNKVDYYKSYINQVVDRLWGKAYKDTLTI